MIVDTSCKVPIKIWATDLEEGALLQAKNLANLPFVFKHVALMPDSHQGYGMPIGGVLATENVIIPSSVGVDIGCGMCAVKTSLTSITKDELKVIMGEIRKVIPVGFEHHKKKQDESLMPKIKNSNWYSEENLKEQLPICGQEYQNALTQIGTLGGGNHFIEIQKGNDGHIWIMIHSGSRNLGLKVAEHYNNLAIFLNKKFYSSVPACHQLAFLPVDSEEGQNYIKEMNYCVEFALANRKLMMERICEVFNKNKPAPLGVLRQEIIFEPMINIAHNYARLENHYGKNVWVHRKGATSAKKGEIGIIPGSQGTHSYITIGKGSNESFQSCSHGAGRKMGREEAKRTLSLDEQKKLMDDQGIVHGIRGINDLDEAPGAYKDIDVVMANQSDLTEILISLEPLAVIKG